MAWPKGVPKNAEQRAKLSAALKGRKMSDEHKQLLSVATTRRWAERDPHLLAAREAATEARRSPLGSRRLQDGYWIVKTEAGWVFEHRLVLSEKLGRPLTSDEDSHHKDENKLNNDPDNLELLPHGEHARLHRLKEKSWT